MISALALIGSAPAGTVHVSIDNLRNHNGLLQVCLTSNPARFPDCVGDPLAHRVTASAKTPLVEFDNVPSGNYAIAVIHDENGNARLDTMMKIPREGFGFSRNPAIRFGPPRFSDAAFALGAGDAQQSVKMRYLL